MVNGLGLLKVESYALPNVLAGERVVPELMQHDCTPQKLADATAGVAARPAAPWRCCHASATCTCICGATLRRSAAQAVAERVSLRHG